LLKSLTVVLNTPYATLLQHLLSSWQNTMMPAVRLCGLLNSLSTAASAPAHKWRHASGLH
jgi:hypothetical protein